MRDKITMSFEFPKGNTIEGTVEQHKSVILEDALKRVEAGDLHGALEIALGILCPRKGKIDLRTIKAAEVNWDDWDDATMGDPMDQVLINQALGFIESSDKEKIKEWLQVMFATQKDVSSSEPMKADASNYKLDPEFQQLTPEACRSKLIERLIVSNPGIPDSAKQWILELIEHHPKLFTNSTITEVRIVYDDKDQYGPSITIGYRTVAGRWNQSFREHQLRVF